MIVLELVAVAALYGLLGGAVGWRLRAWYVKRAQDRRIWDENNKEVPV